MITAVTAFVPILNHPRPAEEYQRLGNRLLAMDSKIPMLFADADLEHCWLYQYLREQKKVFTHSVADNPEKNSVWYHIVQAQKTEWLAAAASVDPFADVFCWIDYGIFHLSGVTEQIIIDFLHRAEDERTVTIPGCWERGALVYDDEQPCWRFCGGVMIVPRKYLDRFNTVMQQEYVRWLELTGNISWEVNTLARVEVQHPDLIWWYKADHDSSIFTNYKTTEYADERRCPPLVGSDASHHWTS